MSLIQHNIEKEEKLIKLLGYRLVGPSVANRWLIIDKNQNQVGFIKYNKFSYHTFIDSNNIFWDYTRSINDKNGNYEFDIKRDNQVNDRVEINMGEYPSLTIFSKEYGFMYLI